MVQVIVWFITFITLWLTLIWFNFLAIGQLPRVQKRFPKVTFCIPVWNEEKTVLKTVQSLVDANYPNAKKEIIVVNDGSSDGTRKIVEQFIKSHPQVQLINKENGGKASAINVALRKATGELFAVMDADSRIEASAIKKVLPHFLSEKTGAVISRIRVDQPRNFFEKMQRFEYVMSSLTRFVMFNFGTLAITHGALSTFRTETLRKVGGFVQDKNNLTEDFEIALRLRSNGFVIVMEPSAISYTHVPKTMPSIWKQRIRWSRGYLYNMWNYRKLFFAKKQGIFGYFQLPINVLAIVLLVGNVLMISYDFGSRLESFVMRSLTIDGYFWTQILSHPGVKEFVLGRNVQMTIPLGISFLLGLYLIVWAHKVFEERLKSNLLPFVVYTLVMPTFSTMNWVSALTKEVLRRKRVWR